MKTVELTADEIAVLKHLNDYLVPCDFYDDKAMIDTWDGLIAKLKKED